MGIKKKKWGCERERLDEKREEIIERKGTQRARI